MRRRLAAVLGVLGALAAVAIAVSGPAPVTSPPDGSGTGAAVATPDSGLVPATRSAPPRRGSVSGVFLDADARLLPHAIDRLLARVE